MIPCSKLHSKRSISKSLRKKTLKLILKNRKSDLQEVELSHNFKSIISFNNKLDVSNYVARKIKKWKVNHQSLHAADLKYES